MAAPTPMTSSRRLSTLVAVFVLAVCCLPAAAQGNQYKVGGEDGWRVPLPGQGNKYYGGWASNITFYVGDTLEFVYKNDTVLRVSKAGYYHCNETVADAAPHDGSTIFLLDAPGDAYFASADLLHCGWGERLAITVLAGAGLPPAPSPSSSAPGPWAWVWSPSASGPAALSPSGDHSAAAELLVQTSSAHAVVLVVAIALAMATAVGLV